MRKSEWDGSLSFLVFMYVMKVNNREIKNKICKVKMFWLGDLFVRKFVYIYVCTHREFLCINTLEVVRCAHAKHKNGNN